MPAPVIVRLGSAPPTKLNASDDTCSVVEIAPSVAVYSWNGVAVPLLKLPIIVTQPVQVVNIAKLPLGAPPMLAGLLNVIDVEVNESDPFRDRVLPAAIGTKCAEAARVVSPAATAPAKRCAFMRTLLQDH